MPPIHGVLQITGSSSRVIQCACTAPAAPPLNALLAVKGGKPSARSAATNQLLGSGYNPGDCVLVNGYFGTLGASTDVFFMTGVNHCPKKPCSP
jgi:hypothetical protein